MLNCGFNNDLSRPTAARDERRLWGISKLTNFKSKLREPEKLEWLCGFEALGCLSRKDISLVFAQSQDLHLAGFRREINFLQIDPKSIRGQRRLEKIQPALVVDYSPPAG